MATGGNGEVGNTNNFSAKKRRCNPAKRWCFTHFPQSEDEMATIIQEFQNLKLKYIIGREICKTTQRIHFQGYIEADKLIRPIERLKNIKGAHWEVARGNRDDNINYCSKENNFKTNMTIKKKIKDPLENKELYEWQKKILELISQEPDDRTINYIWEAEGSRGKTSLAKHIVMNYNAIYVSGNSKDILYAISSKLEEEIIDIVIIDIPRSVEHISYNAIEQIKNGIAFSSKYESKQVIFNSPHIIMFSNQEPDISKLSKDRWNIINL